METAKDEFGKTLEAHAPEFGIALQADRLERLIDYYGLIMKWNERLHLVAPCSPAEFGTRHVLESLTLLKHLPIGATIIDVGSGAGLPVIPCLLVRDDLRATLIESSNRKAVLLREALRPVAPPDRVQVIADRFENIQAPKADFVTCRALDRFSEILPSLIEWAPRNSTLLLFAGESIRDRIQTILGPVTVERIPHSERRFLLIARATN
ncbi:MAG TPA: 16S rRNA (guanine(527)-N(7))-methyltransferase RsmG [Pyrinomonadaceae bacterium]